MKDSAGTLLYRRTGDEWEVLIVKPSGPAARYGWSIPKGLPNPKESLEEAARRETFEETGVRPDKLQFIGKVEYASGAKRVHCFAGFAPNGNPQVNSWEISSAKFVTLREAEELLHRDQRRLIPLMKAFLANG